MEILIAEDNRASRRLLELMLRSWGFEVVVTANGAEALEALTKPDAPKLAILDWMMPVMDGLEVAREVRSLQADSYTYIILLTSRNRKEDMLEGMEAGADDYIIKPLDTRELNVRLNAATRILELQNELIVARESLREQATHDALTGLLNRGAILEALDEEIERARRDGTEVGVVMVDVDRFKRLNDTYGHRAGDEALRHATDRMHRSLRPYDKIGRYGGEEFLVVVPRCDVETASEVAERIRRAVAAEPVSAIGLELPVTVSLGVAAGPPQEDAPADALIQAADVALYRAKEAGRNRVIAATEVGATTLDAAAPEPG